MTLAAMALVGQLPFVTIRMREWTLPDLFRSNELMKPGHSDSSPQALEIAYNSTVLGRGEPYA